jgi:hypothetical protein
LQMDVTWNLMVRSLMTSAWAIGLLAKPRASKHSTSNSRLLNVVPARLGALSAMISVSARRASNADPPGRTV